MFRSMSDNVLFHILQSNVATAYWKSLSPNFTYYQYVNISQIYIVNN